MNGSSDQNKEDYVLTDPTQALNVKTEKSIELNLGETNHVPSVVKVVKEQILIQLARASTVVRPM